MPERAVPERATARIAVWKNGQPSIIRLRTPCALVGEHDVDIVLDGLRVQQITGCDRRQANAAERLGGITCLDLRQRISLNLGALLAPRIEQFALNTQNVRTAWNWFDKIRLSTRELRERRAKARPLPDQRQHTREAFVSWMSRMTGHTVVVDNLTIHTEERLRASLVIDAGDSPALAADAAIYCYTEDRGHLHQHDAFKWKRVHGAPCEAVEEMLPYLPHRWLTWILAGTWSPYRAGHARIER